MLLFHFFDPKYIEQTWQSSSLRSHKNRKEEKFYIFYQNSVSRGVNSECCIHLMTGLNIFIHIAQLKGLSLYELISVAEKLTNFLSF